MQSIPGVRYESSIDFIEPELDPRSRTVPVRIRVDNIDGALKPGMFVQAIILAKVEDARLVPASAVLRTGQRAVVYVEVPGQS